MSILKNGGSGTPSQRPVLQSSGGMETRAVSKASPTAPAGAPPPTDVVTVATPPPPLAS